MFPENNVTIFPTYSLAYEQKTHRQAVQEVSSGLATEEFIPAGTPGGVEVNKEAWRVNNARKRLKSILQPTSIVAEKFEESYTHMARYNKTEFGLALKVFLDWERAGIDLPATMKAEELELALTKANLEWFSFENPSEPETNVLKGYTAPDIKPAFRELLISDTEAKFRLGLLKAECHFGLRDFDKAIEQYSSSLRDLPTLTSDRRKFLALRCGFALLALGDSLFRASRNLSAEQRAAITDTCTAAIRVVTENSVALENPLHKQIVDSAALQQAKLSGRFNVLGFRDSFVPVQRFTFLEGEARRLIGLAKTSANNFRGYLEKANNLEDLEKELEDQLTTAQTNVLTTAQKVSIASARGEIIDNQISAISSKENFLTPNPTIISTAAALYKMIAPVIGSLSLFSDVIL